MDDQEVNDAMLVQAMRKRLMDEIGRGGDKAVVNNNVYGGAVGGGGGIRDQMPGGGDMSPEDRDYFVDITREDLPEINELTGKPKGWHKKVHRFSTAKGGDEGGGNPKKKDFRPAY